MKSTRMKSRGTAAGTLTAAPVIKSTLLFGATGAAVLKPRLLNGRLKNSSA